MGKIAYYARPIDQARHIQHAAVDALVCEQLSQAGYHVYRPASAWQVGYAPVHRTVERINNFALLYADVIVAHLPGGVPSIGVPMEIERATTYGIPVVVVSDVESYSLKRDGVTVVASETDLPAVLADLAPRTYPQEEIRLVVREGHEPPKRAYPDDAGIDLTTVKAYVIHPGQFVDIHTQVDSVQLPDGYWALITGRSSTLRRHKLHVPMAVIDPGWRGPLYIGVWNLGPEPVEVVPGDRLGQMILLPNNPAEIVRVQAVDEHDRGMKGFGSTG
jgi:dUTP pyrophosphatase